MQRNIGSITTGHLQANEHDWSYFVRVDVAAPVGTLRFTDRYANVTENIDGGSATWSVADLKVGALAQGKQDLLVVSSLSFANLDYTWTNWANSPGLRGADVYVYRGQFNSDGTFAGAVLLYEGEIDSHQCGKRAELALKPWRAPWARRVVTAIPGLSSLLPAPLMPEDGTNIYWNTQG